MCVFLFVIVCIDPVILIVKSSKVHDDLMTITRRFDERTIYMALIDYACSKRQTRDLFTYLTEKTDYDISYKLSLMETIELHEMSKSVPRKQTSNDIHANYLLRIYPAC